MIYVECIKNGKYGLRDTSDDTITYLSRQEVMGCIENGFKFWGMHVNNGFLSCQLVKIGRRKKKESLDRFSGLDLEHRIAEMGLNTSLSYNGYNIIRKDYDTYSYDGYDYTPEDLLRRLIQ